MQRLAVLVACVCAAVVDAEVSLSGVGSAQVAAASGIGMQHACVVALIEEDLVLTSGACVRTFGTPSRFVFNNLALGTGAAASGAVATPKADSEPALSEDGKLALIRLNESVEGVLPLAFEPKMLEGTLQVAGWAAPVQDGADSAPLEATRYFHAKTMQMLPGTECGVNATESPNDHCLVEKKVLLFSSSEDDVDIVNCVGATGAPVLAPDANGTLAVVGLLTTAPNCEHEGRFTAIHAHDGFFSSRNTDNAVAEPGDADDADDILGNGQDDDDDDDHVVTPVGTAARSNTTYVAVAGGGVLAVFLVGGLMRMSRASEEDAVSLSSSAKLHSTDSSGVTAPPFPPSTRNPRALSRKQIVFKVKPPAGEPPQPPMLPPV